MFVKRSIKLTLIENYDEANKVEVEHDSIEKHTWESEIKPASSKKPMLLTITKEENSIKLENVDKMVQKLLNKIVDLEIDK